MKDRYLGDRKDFIKFDTALTLYEQIDGINSFTYIPMLTPGGNPNQGNDFRYDGQRRRPALHNFLQHYNIHRNAPNRQVYALRQFMQGQNVNYHPHQDAPYQANAPIRHINRANYFGQIPNHLLNTSLILIDPCTGLQRDEHDTPVRPRRNIEEYLLYTDLQIMWPNVADNSVVLVFQYIRSTNKGGYPAFLARKAHLLNTYCQGCQPPIWLVCDAADFNPPLVPVAQPGLVTAIGGRDAVALIVLTKSAAVNQTANNVLQGYCHTLGYIM